MRIEIVTLFPEMVDAGACYGVTGRALERGIWTLSCRNPRDFATNSYRTVDDRPYGGGPGMVMTGPPRKGVAHGARGHACRRDRGGAGGAFVGAGGAAHPSAGGRALGRAGHGLACRAL